MKLQIFKLPLLFLVVGIIIGGIVYLEQLKPKNIPSETEAEIPLPQITIGKEEKLKQYPLAKEIVNPHGFINTNTHPITISEFIGKKIILVDFWTYSCINCQRTTPYLNAWWSKYKDKGLLIIGVHTPEFEFEKKYENVVAAVKKFGIQYPVVLDNGYATWRAYRNRYWPRKYLIDIDGFIVYDHIGEGAYEETEKKIQELLEERMQVLGMKGEISEEISKPAEAVSVDTSGVGSTEVYFGAFRNVLLENGSAEKEGQQSFKEPPEIQKNRLYLVGDWNIEEEFSENVTAGAKIIFRYQAKDVYMVANSQNGVTARILRDGKQLGDEAGEDVNQDGTVFFKEDRLYKLVEDSAYGEHTLEIIIENPGFRAFTFTFG